MAPSESVNRVTRAEWRELGFHYDFDDATQTWTLRGARAGLLGFAERLRQYAGDPRRAGLSEHDHYGPYMYLEVATWSKREINDQWIAGSLEDLRDLAHLVSVAVEHAEVGAELDIGSAYCPGADARLILVLASPGFDPARADAACW